MQLEREKMDFELKMKAASVWRSSSEIDEDEVDEEDKEGSVVSSHSRRRIGVKGPKMPCFDERSDQVDALFHRFEICADSQNWTKD